MANKREIKKAIHQVTAALFTECLLFKEIIPQTELLKADIVLDEILDFQRNLLSRVDAYDNKEESQSVRQYFKKLNENVVSEAQSLYSKINGLNKE
jgi:hypothetical protein